MNIILWRYAGDDLSLASHCLRLKFSSKLRADRLQADDESVEEEKIIDLKSMPRRSKKKAKNRIMINSRRL
jgi:hypothetical protein